LERGYFVPDTASAALVRYNTDGTLDTSFGAGGVVTREYVSDYGAVIVSHFRAAFVQADGSILVWHTGFFESGPDVITASRLVRLTSEGKADTMLYRDYGTRNEYSDILIQPDNSFLILNIYARKGPMCRFVDYRQFSNSGKVLNEGTHCYQIPALEPYRYCEEQMPNATRLLGRTLAALSDVEKCKYILQWDEAGRPNGFFNPNKELAVAAAALAPQHDGKLLTVGTVSSTLSVARYFSNGILDTSFGISGTTSITVPPLASGGAVALQLDGKIVVAGSQKASDAYLAPRTFLLARLIGPKATIRQTHLPFTDH
jgi:uncharacterized delta-60 repeat protein